NSEPVQIMHYVHEDTRERLDYYGVKARLGFDESLMATIVLYLSNVSHGGETLFHKSEPNTAPDENISNARCPVLQGEKWCATKYFYLSAIDRTKISLKIEQRTNTLMKKIVVQSGLPKENAIGIMGSQADIGHQQHHNSQFLPFSRQTSFYSLTLDEVQNQLLGKPLKTQPQQKTVDEVWRYIQQGQDNNNTSSNQEDTAKERQPTLGEMTLEDFLVKVGIVSQWSSGNKAATPVIGPDLMISAPQTQWLQYQLPSVQQQQQQQSQQQNMMGVFMPSHPIPQRLTRFPNSLLDTDYPENQLAISSPLMGTLSYTQAPSCKRGASIEIIEKIVERRQKRMIKNRESATRSRARKFFFLDCCLIILSPC
ncbi:hypothetical protein IFM89_034661, partial [Coptis chinensis]